MNKNGNYFNSNTSEPKDASSTYILNCAERGTTHSLNRSDQRKAYWLLKQKESNNQFIDEVRSMSQEEKGRFVHSYMEQSREYKRRNIRSLLVWSCILLATVLIGLLIKTSFFFSWRYLSLFIIGVGVFRYFWAPCSDTTLNFFKTCSFIYLAIGIFSFIHEILL